MLERIIGTGNCLILSTIILLFSITTLANDKKIIRWQTKQIKKVYEISKTKYNYYISVGFADDKDFNTAYFMAKENARFELPNVVSVYIRSAVLTIVELNDKSVNKDELFNLKATKSAIHADKVHFKLLDTYKHNKKYYIAVIAYINQSELSRENNILLPFHESTREKIFSQKVDSLFLDLLNKKITLLQSQNE